MSWPPPPPKKNKWENVVTLRRVLANIVAVEEQLSITYSECVFEALGIQQAMHMRIAICGLPRSTRFFYIISQMARVFDKNFI